MRKSTKRFSSVVASIVLVGCASLGYDLENNIKFHSGSIDLSVDEVAAEIQGFAFKEATRCYHDVKIGRRMASASGGYGDGWYIAGTSKQKAVMTSQMQFVQDVWRAVAIREGDEKSFNNSKAGEVAAGMGRDLVEQFSLINIRGVKAQRINNCTSPVFSVLQSGLEG